MTHATIEAPALLTQLVERHHAQWVDQDNLATWLDATGDQLLFFAGDPVRFPEAMDVAVVLPELLKASSATVVQVGVAVPETAQALALQFGSQRWPTLMFFRDGQYTTTLSGMHDWSDYVGLFAQALTAPRSRAPTVGIAVVSADASAPTCH